MIQALVAVAGKPEKVMHGIIEKASDSRTSDSVRLGFEVEHLADHAGLPEKAPVSVRLILNDLAEDGDHTEGENSVAGNLLVATQPGRNLSKIPLLKQIEGLIFIYAIPQKGWVGRSPHILKSLLASKIEIEPASQTVDVMDKKKKINAGLTRLHIERGAVIPWNSFIEYGEELVLF